MNQCIDQEEHQSKNFFQSIAALESTLMFSTNVVLIFAVGLLNILNARGQDASTFSMTDFENYGGARHKPIFRFNDGAGTYCFPDDKREISTRDNTCRNFDPNAPVFVSYKKCCEYTVLQYSLWYGLQKGCITDSTGGRHGNDLELVQIWMKNGSPKYVRYNQHNGYYFKEVGLEVEMEGSRPVIYIGKIAHGSYHRGCNGRDVFAIVKSLSSAPISHCNGGCGYWDDFRNSQNNNFVLSNAQAIGDDSPRSIDCNPGLCEAGHVLSRWVASSSCFGIA